LSSEGSWHSVCSFMVSWMFHHLAPSSESLYILIASHCYFDQWENCIKWLWLLLILWIWFVKYYIWSVKYRNVVLQWIKRISFIWSPWRNISVNFEYVRCNHLCYWIVCFVSAGESNVYTLGNIGGHRIVCTKLPSVGHTREAMTAAGNTTTRLLGN